MASAAPKRLLNEIPFYENRFDLQIVCRNTAEIANAGGQIRGERAEAPVRHGPEPTVDHIEFPPTTFPGEIVTGPGTVNAVVNRVKSILKEGVPPREVMVLSSFLSARIARSLKTAGVATRQIDEFEELHEESDPTTVYAGRVTVSTPSAQIGMEADAVVCAFDYLDIVDLYIAVTRARSVLFLIGDAKHAHHKLGFDVREIARPTSR